MLQKRNIGHVATAEAVGATAGFYTGYMSLLILESKDFCNKYIFTEPRDEGLITIKGFMIFLGVVYLATSFFVGLFKHENSEMDEKLREYPDYGIRKAYPTLLNILKLKPVLRLALFLLTVKITFGATDSMTFLKLIDYGMPKDKIALMGKKSTNYLMHFKIHFSLFSNSISSNSNSSRFCHLSLYNWKISNDILHESF